MAMLTLPAKEIRPQTERRKFQLYDDKYYSTVLWIFCTHAQKKYLTLLKLMSTSILKTLAILLFEK